MTHAPPTFFATVQNKLHWAVTGHTAAETIAERVDATKPNMGLTNWPKGTIRKADVTVAKNYLGPEELTALDRIVTMYLDYAEDQAARRRPMTMAEWAGKLDAFLEFNDRDVLANAGKVSAAVAERLAHEQYEMWTREQRRLEAEEPASDFDRVVKKLGNAKSKLRRGEG